MCKILRHAVKNRLSARALSPTSETIFHASKGFLRLLALEDLRNSTRPALKLAFISWVWKDFPDHYMYRNDDMAQLLKRAESEGARLLTTEKDYVRLPLEYRTKVIALPVKLQFADEAAVKNLIAARPQ